MNTYHGLEVAIIGMSGRFPSADSVSGLWELLSQEREGISTFSDEDLRESGVSEELMRDSRYVRRYGQISDTLSFDAELFGYTSADATIMDPQFRVFHECAWTALEDAGHLGDCAVGLIGLYAGASDNLEWMARLAKTPGLIQDGFRAASLTNRDYLCSRVAYALNLRGPVVTVQTGCSTSLVAIHLACQGLINGECDIALAGGVTIRRNQKVGAIHVPGMVDSPDGICRPFDAAANGIVSGDGCGIVVLRRLEDAIASRDNIVAVIKGSAVLNDGREKAGFTAPGVDGQLRTTRAALQAAEVEASTITYVEAHGTATPLGDPIEVEALSRAFAGSHPKSCRLGSIKSNIGHLDVAAGVAGVIKVAISLKARRIPKTLHFRTPNGKIDFDSTPFFVGAGDTEWQVAEGPLRAGVSSFGIGGTNAHAILEEAPPSERHTTGLSPRPHIVCLSAQTPRSLQGAVCDLHDYLASRVDLSLTDLCHTLHVGRRSLPHRAAFVVDSVDQLREVLQKRRMDGTPAGPSFGDQPICFLFPGQGSQMRNMGRDLYEGEPEFRAQVDRCLEIVRERSGVDLASTWFVGDPMRHDNPPGPVWVQPAIFIHEFAVAQTLIKLGAKPSAMLGHSIGEYVAACVSGVFSLENALELMVCRERLVRQLAPGAMLAVRAPETAVRLLMGTDLDIAAINSSEQVVVSGDPGAIAIFAADLKARGLEHRQLDIDRAFHSRSLSPILGEFQRAVEKIERMAPQIPFVSSVTGDWITSSEARSSDYWVRQLGGSVQFARGLDCLGQLADSTVIETGPGSTLTALARGGARETGGCRYISLGKRRGDDRPELWSLYGGLCEIFRAGCTMDWSVLYKEMPAKRIPLPTYRFDRHRYEAVTPEGPRDDDATRPAGTYGKNGDSASWLYECRWEAGPPASVSIEESGQSWLVFDDAHSVGATLADLLVANRKKVWRVERSAKFRCTDGGRYHLNPLVQEDYSRLIREIAPSVSGVLNVVHLWSVYPEEKDPISDQALNTAFDNGFGSILMVCKALTEPMVRFDSHFVIVSSDSQNLANLPGVSPAKSAVLGLCRVMSQEFPGISSRHIDLHLSKDGSWSAEADPVTLLKELCAPTFEMFTAFRKRVKWVETLAPTTLPPAPHELPSGGSRAYLITGGLGRIGITIAQRLALLTHRPLVLASRSSLPPREDWDRILAADADGDIARLLRKIHEIERSGSEVDIRTMDVADLGSMVDLVRYIDRRYGGLAGVVHAAGVADVLPINEATPSAAWAAMRAKILGTRNLQRACAGMQLDFCVLFSSLSTVLGGLGFAAYSGANSFMDLFAPYAMTCGDHAWLAVDWDAWDFEEAGHDAPKNSVEAFALKPEEGSGMFLRLLGLVGLKSRVVVSTGNLKARSGQYVRRSVVGLDRSSLKTIHERPHLHAEAVEAATDTERTVAEMWRECLGLRQVGVLDHLFDLGGDSLLMTRLGSLLRREFDVELPLTELFALTTIRAQSAAVDSALRERTAVAATGPIPRRHAGERTALSFAQQRLWFIDQLEGSGNAYQISGAVRLFGKLDRDALQGAMDGLLARHESLRSRYGHSDGEPYQEITDIRAFELSERDLRGSAARDCEGVIAKHICEEGRVRFELAKDPPIRARLLRVRESEWVFVVTMHHIISDDWSLGILMHELGALYSAKVDGRECMLPPMGIQYADFASWQLGWLNSEGMEAQLEFWKGHIAGAHEVISLPTDRPRPPVQTYRGATVRRAFGVGLSAGIRDLARNCDATVFMTLYTAFAILLQRLSGQSDVVIGTPVANRQHADLEGVVGFFVNTLPLRIAVSEAATVRESILRVRDATLAGFSHQDVPFEKIVEAVQPKRSLDRSPLFQVMLTLQNAPQRDLRLSGLRLQPVEVPLTTTKCDLSLLVKQTPEQIFTSLVYSTDLFDGQTTERWADQLETLLEGMVESPGAAVRRISSLRKGADERLLMEFGRGIGLFSGHKFIHEQIRDQVMADPDAPAVRCGATRLTRGELDRRSDALCNYLRGEGIGPQRLVAIRMRNSASVVVAMIGVLKAGAAYVPLDPGWPARRVDYVLGDTQAPLILTDETPADWTAPSTTKVVRLEDACRLGWTGKASVPEDGGRPSLKDLAYVIYTSGSTGEPKGVMVDHLAIANYVQHVSKQFDVQSGRGSLIVTPLVFDLALTGLYAPLAQGREVRLADTAHDPANLALLLDDRESLSVLKVTPSHLPIFAELTGGRLLDLSVRALVIGGEALTADVAESWRKIVTGARLFNHYGPTETTVGCAIYEIPSGISGAVPIGRPISNVSVFVLDVEGEILPIGQIGEIHVAGLGLARGYLNRPDLTAEKFIANPFGEPGERMYRTGDLGRWRADGTVECLGRRDAQLKLHGFRVEPGEVESHLRAHPSIDQAAVMVRELSPGEAVLVAYMKPAGASVDCAEVRRYLSGRLPEYMVPRAFQVVDSWPLAASGKLDHTALPAPTTARAQEAYEAPRGELEQRIAEIWQDLLRVGSVGRHDDFFHLGGTSLRAVALASRLEALGITVPVMNVFRNSKLGDFAQTVLCAQTSSDSSGVVALHKSGTGRPLFLVHMLTGDVFPFVPLVRALNAEFPVYGLRITDRQGTRSIAALAAQHIKAMRTVQERGPYRIAGHSFGGIIAWEIAAQLMAADEPVEFIGLIDTYRPTNSRRDASELEGMKLLLTYIQVLHPSLGPKRLADLLELGTLEAMLEGCKTAQLLPEGLSLKQIMQWTENCRDVLLAGERYFPQPLPTDVHLFAAEVADSVSSGWKELATGSLHVWPVGGGHVSILQHPHVASLADSIVRALKRAESAEPTRQVSAYVPIMAVQLAKTPKLLCFCVPGSGANCACFIPLANALGRDTTLYGLQLRGLDADLVPHSTVEAAASCFVRAIRAAAPGGPFRVAGHSFGAWIAIEICRQLSDAGERVSPVVLLDPRVPMLGADATPVRPAEALVRLGRALEQSFGRKLGMSVEELDQYSYPEQLELLGRRLAGAGLLPSSNRLAAIRRMVRVFTANTNACYLPAAPYLSEAVLLRAGAQDDGVDEAERAQEREDWISGWNRVVPNSFVREIEGNHMTILKMPGVASIADVLRELWAH